MLTEKRLDEMLARATTDVQRSRMRELAELGKDVYAENRLGKSVIAAFRRYCQTCDPEKIDKGLYRFSTMGAGGLNDIAHYNLHGFRAEYPHPAHYIQRLLVPEVQRWDTARRQDPNAYHSFYVYTDGMTAGEVALAILEVAAELKDHVTEDYYAQRNTRELAAAQELAERIGMRLVVT